MMTWMAFTSSAGPRHWTVARAPSVCTISVSKQADSEKPEVFVRSFSGLSSAKTCPNSPRGEREGFVAKRAPPP